MSTPSEGRVSCLYERVLRATAFGGTDSVWWRLDDKEEELELYINCNDAFYWGCADREEITPENIEALESAKKALGADEHGFAGLLFCARVRELRPQGALYGYIPEELWPLFDACGPVREVDIGNPKEHPTPSTQGES